MGNKIILQNDRNGQKPKTNNNQIDELCNLYRFLVQQYFRYLALSTIYPEKCEERTKYLTLMRGYETWRFELERKGIGE